MPVFDMSLPWLKWYFEDWQGDEGLALCSYGARGLWMELLAIMRKAEPYGHLLINGRQPTTRELLTLTRSTRHSTREIEMLLSELDHHGVYSRTEAGVIISRRLIRDEQRRIQASQDGSKGGNPTLKGIHKDTDKGEDKPHAQEHADAHTRLPDPRGKKLEARSERVRARPLVKPPNAYAFWSSRGMHVPWDFHDETALALGSDDAAFAFYKSVDDEWKPGGPKGAIPVGDSTFKFWQARRSERFGTTATATTPAEAKSAATLAAAQRFIARGQS